MYTVLTDPSRNLLSIKVTGFWTEQIMAEYLVHLRKQSTALRTTGGCTRILVDMTDYPIQSQAIADGHQAALKFASEAMGARAAIVMKGGLSRLQASRVAKSSGHRLFDDITSASQWLMADREV